MTRKLLGFAALAALMAPAVSYADTGFGAHAGTSGFGAEVRHDLSDRIALRGSISTLGIDLDETYDGIAYTGNFDYDPAGVFIDFHPFDSGLFLTGGALIGAPEIGLSATPAGNTEIGGQTYTPQEIGTLYANTDMGDAAPFVGLGWTSAHGRSGGGMYFTALAGAAFYESANATLFAEDGTLVDDDAFLASLAEEEAELEDELSAFEVYPVLQFTAGYRF